MECLDCKNIFKSKYSLQHHRKTAKYCLKLRGKKNDNYKCTGCNKNSTDKFNFKRHKLNCQGLITNIKIEMLEKEIINITNTKNEIILKLESQLQNIQKQMVDIYMKAVSRPITATTNNTINNNQKILNLLPLTEKHFEEQAEFLNIEHIKNGAEGYAQYAVEFPLKNRIMCSDYARRKIKYKDNEGNIITDPEMSKISQKLFKAIENQNDTLISNHITELQHKLFRKNSDCPTDMNEYESELFSFESSKMIDFITNLASQRRKIKDVASGMKTDMYYNILKNVCSMMV